jgi:methylase of polypeptide subunit release factors
MAKKNARRLGLSKKVHFFSMNMMETLKGTFDCIVANLPYLSLQEYARAKKEYPEILAEPKHAVCAGKTGFELFNIFFQHAPRHLNPHGVLFLEIGSGQQNGIKKLTKKYFPKNTNVLFIRDLAKRIRVARIEKRAYSF